MKIMTEQSAYLVFIHRLFLFLFSTLTDPATPIQSTTGPCVTLLKARANHIQMTVMQQWDAYRDLKRYNLIK
jgi:hypothetical protein